MFSVPSVLMNHENVELLFCDAERLPEAFRKSKKGSIYLTPYRVRDDVQMCLFLFAAAAAEPVQRARTGQPPDPAEQAELIRCELM